jgi:uncharacterized protein (DUF1015 family)
VDGPPPGAPTIAFVISSPVDSPAPRATGLDIRPFRALVYRSRNPEALARVSSPAYDLVTPAGRERLAAADRHNVVRLILPEVALRPAGADPLGDADADPVRRSARQAAETLARWRADGVLEELGGAALWLYELAPTDGAPPTVGWLGAVALPPPGSSAVLPHEDTYAPAVEGRRALLAATRTDLEPIVLAHDPDEAVAALTRAAAAGPPSIEVSDAEGVRHRLWQVTDPATVQAVRTALAGTRAVIADGHHRFAAAQAHHRSLPDMPGSDAVLALVTSSGPGGLRVQAIHRVVPDLSLERALAAARTGFAVDELPLDRAGGPRPTAQAWLDTAPGPAFLLSDGRRLVALTRPDDATSAAVPAEAPAAWRALDVVLAHHGLIDRLWQVPDEPSSVLVAHHLDEALRLARERSGTALLLRPPSPGDVVEVARAGARMPRKSTLFVPKPRTGLVLRPLG